MLGTLHTLLPYEDLETSDVLKDSKRKLTPVLPVLLAVQWKTLLYTAFYLLPVFVYIILNGIFLLDYSAPW